MKMKRPPAALQWLAVFAAGAALGLSLGPRAHVVSAVEGPAAAGQGTPAETGRAADDAALRKQLARSYEQFRSVDAAFELAAKAVSPSVVHIVAKKVGDWKTGRYEESGSGVIVRADAGAGLFVLTNNHVVEGAVAGDISIALHDGQVLHPEKFWADDKADVAVLKLARADLPAATLGNSDDARVGSWVLALGSPFGLSHSVSHGIVSARGRHEEELEFDGVEHQEFLQTDAAINPGNSGGPLVNLRGDVIGINTAIASEHGGSEGVGFSIPINLARWAMGQLIAGGKVRRGAMGVNLRELTSPDAAELGLDRPRGARVVTVRDESPAALAGLVPGDVILRFNGVEVLDHNHLINLVSIMPIGQAAEVAVWRAKAPLRIQVKIADREDVVARLPADLAGRLRGAEGPHGRAKAAPNPPADLGLTLISLDPKTSSRYFPLAEEMQGVLIAKVDSGSPFAAYLKPMDVLQKVRAQPVRTVEEALKALRSHGNFSAMDLDVRRSIDGTLQRRSIRVP